MECCTRSVVCSLLPFQRGYSRETNTVRIQRNIINPSDGGILFTIDCNIVFLQIFTFCPVNVRKSIKSVKKERLSSECLLYIYLIRNYLQQQFRNKGTFLEVNEAFLKRFGFSRREIIRTSLFAIIITALFVDLQVFNQFAQKP
jgi:hypothetical protein